MTLILNGTDNSATTPAVTGTDTDTGVYYPAANQVAIATSGTQAMLANASQGVQFNYGISVGGTAPSTDGTGVKFPATQISASDANTLDDYEEGTWTPVDGSGAGLSFSNTSGNCFYTKIGRLVTATFRVTYPSTASGSFAYIGGLPFASNGTTVNVQGCCMVENNYQAGTTATINVGETRALILYTSGGAVQLSTNANVSGKDFRGTFVYITS
jgi:hypothetical protein